MMKKRFLAILLALVIILGTIQVPSALAAGNTPFTDVHAGDWYADAVQYVYENSLMVGTSRNKFSPNSTTTRGQVVTILYRMEGSPSISSACNFTDVEPGSWYEDAVIWGTEHKIVAGKSATTYAPNSSISREETAAMLYRYSAYKGYSTDNLASLDTFTDSGKISSWAEASMKWAVGEGLLYGISSNTIAPKQTATRAQIAAILMRFCEKISDLDKVEYASPEEYFEDSSMGIIETISDRESADVLTEAEAINKFATRGFGQGVGANVNTTGYPVTYQYGIGGDYTKKTNASASSSVKHPMYETYYLSGDDEGNQVLWIIYIINGDIFASPISFVLETTCDKEVLVTENESGKLTSYYNGKFYETISNGTTVTTKTVSRIDAATLDRITFDDLCDLTNATQLTSEDSYSDQKEFTTALPVDFMDVSEPIAADIKSRSKDTAVIVSLGDSYSSGEGIEEFIDQHLPWPERVESQDFLAHRSTNAWPTLLKVGDKNVDLHFVAVSGAETKHIDLEGQTKDYDIPFDPAPLICYGVPMPKQIDIFDQIGGDTVDYVTITIGGNDVGFSQIITDCIGSIYLKAHIGPIQDLEEDLKKAFENIGKHLKNIGRVYETIAEKAPNATIIVAGYPKLFDRNGKGVFISKKEADLINSSVHTFNNGIKRIIEGYQKKSMKIEFVDVEAAFENHEAYSDEAWINPIWLFLKSQDLERGKLFKFGSAYSMHPTEEGAKKGYATRVNAKIAECEENKNESKPTPTPTHTPTPTPTPGDIIDSGNCGAQGDNVKWTLYKDGALKISGVGRMADYKYEEGDTENGFVINYLSNSPFYQYREKIALLEIEFGVTSIGNCAFWYCENIGSIMMPDSVTNIGDDAFGHCNSLTNIKIPDSVIYIGNHAFFNCYSLQDIIMSDNVTSIGDGAFGSCFTLTSITMPDSLTSIGNNAFSSCFGLTNVKISSNITSIGRGLFGSCIGLNSIVVPNGVTSIGCEAFFGCGNLTSIIIPNSVTSIGYNAFPFCNSLSNIYFTGSEEQWKNIKSTNYDGRIETFFDFRDDLTNVTIRYNGTGPR